MGWEDPSPRARAGTSAGNPVAQPGYADPGVRLSFGTIVVRALVALLVGFLMYQGAHKGLGGWLGPARAIAVLACSLSLAAVTGWLVLRTLMRTPEYVGGRGWFGRRRGWDDTSSLSFGEAVAADAVGEVVGAVIDAVTD
jgi:hypothetical protein